MTLWSHVHEPTAMAEADRPGGARAASAESRKIVVVGPCAAGKSTLVTALRELGYDAHVSGQEHSEIAMLWQHSQPDVLIALGGRYWRGTRSPRWFLAGVAPRSPGAATCRRVAGSQPGHRHHRAQPSDRRRPRRRLPATHRTTLTSGVCPYNGAGTIIAPMNKRPAMTPRPFRMILPLVAIVVLGWLTPLIASADATPVAGGVVVIEAQRPPQGLATPPAGRNSASPAQSIDPAPLDPAVARDVNSAFMTRQVFRGLTRFDENLEPVPELAQRIEISADGLTYRIQLRDDARFADGSPITAQDVAFSLTRALSPQTAADAGAALAGPSYLGDIVGADEVIRGESSELAGLRVVDDRTVEIDLKAPARHFS